MLILYFKKIYKTQLLIPLTCIKIRCVKYVCNNLFFVFLSSWGGYNDELVWAALWLYKATGTQSYLTYAVIGYSAYGFSNYADVLSWDSKISGTKVLLAQITGQASYVTDVQNICNYYINQVPKSPLGEPFFSYWGNLRYTATAGFTCLMVSHFLQVILYSSFFIDYQKIEPYFK
jgi:hypothetical protein